jgi:hypothetical protein
VAKKLCRRYLGFELSGQYAEQIRRRLAAIQPGDPLDGAAEPLLSAPTTADGRRLDENGRRRKTREKKSGGTGKTDQLTLL